MRFNFSICKIQWYSYSKKLSYHKFNPVNFAVSTNEYVSTFKSNRNSAFNIRNKKLQLFFLPTDYLILCGTPKCLQWSSTTVFKINGPDQFWRQYMLLFGKRICTGNDLILNMNYPGSWSKLVLTIDMIPQTTTCWFYSTR